MFWDVKQGGSAMVKKIVLASVVMLMANASFAATTQAANISVKGASVEIGNQLNPEVKMDIANKGLNNVALIAATSPVAQQVQTPSLNLKPHKESDNGIRIPLIDLNEPLKKNEQVPLTLIFSDGSYINVTANVT
jgi:copper(I)-binding protein